MAINGPTSYVLTTQIFITHWTGVDKALLPTERLVLPSGMMLAGFMAQRVLLLDKREAVENAETDLSFARSELDIKKAWLHERLNLFNEAVMGKLTGSVFARTLSLVPGIGAGQESFMNPMKGARRSWEKINHLTQQVIAGGLTLKDGTSHGMFAAAIIELGALYDAVTNAEKDMSMDIAEREDVEAVLYAAMKQYRRTAPSELPSGSALLETIPRLTPEGGRTAAPVELFGGYDAVNMAADLNGLASPDPDLEGYEARRDANNHIAGTVAAGAPRVLKMTKGLQAPGAVACYKVVVKLKSGGEAGSGVIKKVERSADGWRAEGPQM